MEHETALSDSGQEKIQDCDYQIEVAASCSLSDSISVSSEVSMSKIPHDTIIDILSRLPVKSICRFRCVSKTWLHLTYEPHFVATHLSRHQKQKLILSSNKSLFSLDQEGPIDDDMLPSELDYPLKGDFNNEWIQMLGSCNGLVCIMPQPEAFFVFNPSTRESVRVPHCPMSSHADHPEEVGYDVDVHGFGYAPSVKDYMFVNIYKGRFVFIFSLRNKSWTRVQDFPYKYLLNDSETLLKGAVHWLCMGPGPLPVIAALDLAQGKFSGLSPPESVVDSNSYTPGVLRDCLCLLHHNDHERQRIFWIMKEYGVKESWTKILIAEPFFSLQPLCYWKNTKILAARNRRKILLFNPRDGTCKNLLANGLQVPFYADVYVESLVSPNFRLS
ncbi:F-box/kelch-repeat protein At3g06240-like [Argentina anserina]|uniref:F-box/kelch-repeat protein At3g06240-like n=1 Tax=Argentina anserina TaxID=57926 RepID=UPI00217628A7|nr:F-box/kelch-repeat protein At3g06240-like [Potentilla anserina]